jgi:hypothetical protein
VKGTGTGTPPTARLLEDEARGLLTRLDQITPFVAHETMVLAAALPFPAMRAIEGFLYDGRQRLRARAGQYLEWLTGPGRDRPAAEQQHRFVLIRLEFNDVLAQFDVFTEVVTQRSEHRTGVLLSGLDVLAADALTVRAPGMDRVPAVCYLARGPGAAIRRARTRLPGGQPNPVAVIRVPRERMVGGGIASSLVHEVGHQGAALLDLVPSLRADLSRRAADDPEGAWHVWDGWISEIIADCWSVGTLGMTSTLGLMAVVSLPSFFVFRPSGADPHPVPYVRVLVSTGIGEALYPHPQWAALRDTWRAMYPVADLPAHRRADLGRLEAEIPRFVQALVDHRPATLHGARIRDLWPVSARRPELLLARFRAWGDDLRVLARQRPALVFAVLGQAKAVGLLSPEAESRLLSDLLTAWAVRSSLEPDRPTADGRSADAGPPASDVPGLPSGAPSLIPFSPGLARAQL